MKIDAALLGLFIAIGVPIVALAAFIAFSTIWQARKKPLRKFPESPPRHNITKMRQRGF